MDYLAPANHLLNLYEADKNDKDDQFTVPILRNLLNYAPNTLGRDNVCKDIIGCTSITEQVDLTKLRRLAAWYKNGLLIPSEAYAIPCRVVSSNHWFEVLSGDVKTPAVSSHSSKVEPSEETIELVIEEAKRNPSLMKELVSPFFDPCCCANIPPQALERDNNRCLITGRIDMDAFEEAFENGEVDPEGPTPGYTQAAHILRPSLSRNSRDIGVEVSDDLLGSGYGSYAQSITD
jgi:hypothetical protein